MSRARRIRKPKSIGSPVLESVLPVIAASRDVTTNVETIAEHADWLALEELPFPDFAGPFGMGGDADLAMDFTLVSASLNFAFTDFRKRVVFTAEYKGQTWSDAEGLFASIKRALDVGIPFLDGRYLAQVTKQELQHIFRGSIEIPMLDERVEILHNVGKVLAEKYAGRFCNFVRAGRPRAYDRGRGLLERLVTEFPRFNDISRYGKHELKIFKLAQLGLWMLHCTLFRSRAFQLEDVHRLTAFADYIVPLALRAMGILRYSRRLAKTIDTGKLVPRDSEQEVEIRAHTIYAMALFCEEVNERRPRNMPVINAQLDARLWTHFHVNFCPHHLTRTIMY